MKHLSNYALILITFQLFILCRVSAVEDGSCALRGCKGRNSSFSDYLRRCHCDSECGNYGDCCYDSPYANVSKSLSGRLTRFECIGVKFKSGVYIKRACEVIPKNTRLYRYCRWSRNYEEQVANYTFKLPVTTSNGITYGNKYCAMCSNAINYTTWDVHFDCETHSAEINMTTRDRMVKNFVFNDTLQSWVFVSLNTSENCVLSPVPSQEVQNKIRNCRADMVSSCPTNPDGTKVRYSDECEKYTSIVQQRNGTYFKNEYCALCNNISSSELRCRRSSSTRTTLAQTILSSANATPTSAPLTTSTSTSAPSTTTTFTATTRRRTAWTWRPWPSTTPSPPSTTPSPPVTNVTTQVREFLHILVKSNCNDLLDSLTLTKLVIETKSFRTMKRTYIKDSNLITAFPKRICKEYEIEEDSLVEESYLLQYFVNLGTFVSVLFTLSHLYDFLFSITNSTSTQRSFASYGTALVITNVGFFVSNISYMSINFCRLLGPITYFAFLTSFFWLSALSFEIACKTWRCVREIDNFDANRAEKTDKVTAYSLISWIFPLIILIIMSYEAETYGDFTHVLGVYETCWFPEKETFVKFFIFPLIVTISINFAFWILSTYVIWVQKSVAAKLLSEHGIDFRFHTALIITSNLMWLTALIGVDSEDSFSWVCFACLDATLGLLVYLCSPVKRPFAIKITAYFNGRFLSVGENEISK